MGTMNQYTCQMCGGTYLNDVPEVLKVAEAERNFGSMPEQSDRASLCGDCYQEFMKWFNEERPDLRDKNGSGD